MVQLIGAIITYLAARYHLTLSERQQIDVITLGGGRSITHKYFKGRIVNYYSSNDPLVIVDNSPLGFSIVPKNIPIALPGLSGFAFADKDDTLTFIVLTAAPPSVL